MSRAVKEAVVICLDVSKYSSEISDEKTGRTFLERSLECIRKLIVRKIFTKPNDEIGIVLFGSDQTKNDLYNQNLGYSNIVELDTLKMPSWTMLEELDKIKSCKASTGWSEGLIVALNYLSNEVEAKKFSHLRVILFTNFMNDTTDEDMDVITENINNLQIELIGVSDTICQENSNNVNSNTWQFSQNPQKTSIQYKSEKVFEKMTENIEGAALCHIDYVESQFVYYQKKTTRGSPWNVPLKIGSDFSMNVSAYVYIQDAKPVTFKTQHADFHTATKMVTEYTKNNETIEKPKEEDVVKAYFYGSKTIATDDTSMVHDSGDKGLSCLAFCKKKRCSPNLYAGKGCHVVVPQKDCSKSATLFGSLIKNMIKKDYFMLARKVYRKGSKATIVGLFPQIREDGCCFVMIELPHDEDIKKMKFESFPIKKSVQPSDEQLDAMKRLVESMDLMNAIDDDSGISEAFTPENSLNPFHQHMCRVISHRALHPTAPLPPFDEELRKMIDVPEKIKKNSADAIKDVERLFPLEIIKHREKKVFGQKLIDDADVGDDYDMTDVTQAVSNEKQIIAVGTVSPAEDFLYLVHKQTEQFSTLCAQIQSVIYELIFKATTDMSDKVLEAIVAYRDTAKIQSPFNYNAWIQELKKMMIEKNKIDEWNKIIVKEGLGLITINESPISTITMEENLGFYEIDTKDTSQMPSKTVPDEDDELENLL